MGETNYNEQGLPSQPHEGEVGQGNAIQEQPVAANYGYAQPGQPSYGQQPGQEPQQSWQQPAINYAPAGNWSGQPGQAYAPAGAQPGYPQQAWNTQPWQPESVPAAQPMQAAQAQVDQASSWSPASPAPVDGQAAAFDASSAPYQQQPQAPQPVDPYAGQAPYGPGATPWQPTSPAESETAQNQQGSAAPASEPAEPLAHLGQDNQSAYQAYPNQAYGSQQAYSANGYGYGQVQQAANPIEQGASAQPYYAPTTVGSAEQAQPVSASVDPAGVDSSYYHSPAVDPEGQFNQAGPVSEQPASSQPYYSGSGPDQLGPEGQSWQPLAEDQQSYAPVATAQPEQAANTYSEPNSYMNAYKSEFGQPGDQPALSPADQYAQGQHNEQPFATSPADQYGLTSQPTQAYQGAGESPAESYNPYSPAMPMGYQLENQNFSTPETAYQPNQPMEQQPSGQAIAAGLAGQELASEASQPRRAESEPKQVEQIDGASAGTQPTDMNSSAQSGMPDYSYQPGQSSAYTPMGLPNQSGQPGPEQGGSSAQPLDYSGAGMPVSSQPAAQAQSQAPASQQAYPGQPYQAYPSQPGQYGQASQSGQYGQPGQQAQPGQQMPGAYQNPPVAGQGEQAAPIAQQPAAQTPAAASPQAGSTPNELEPVGRVHSKLVAGLLGIFLGAFGLQNFYLGNTGRAMTQLLISCIGVFFFFIGPILSWIWGIIEGVQILTSHTGSPYHQDASGRELAD